MGYSLATNLRRTSCGTGSTQDGYGHLAGTEGNPRRWVTFGLVQGEDKASDGTVSGSCIRLGRDPVIRVTWTDGERAGGPVVRPGERARGVVETIR